MVWNPTLLAALASPNVPDYAGRISQMDLNSAQREKMLAELAYLPQQQQNEALKNQAYLLQQGYMIDPATGRPVMTPAKAAQVQAQQALLQSLGLNNGNPTSPPTSGAPSLPIGDRTQGFVPPDASANMYNYAQDTDSNPAPTNAPIIPQLQLAAGINGNTQNSLIPRLNDVIDSGAAQVPSAVPQTATPQMQPQAQQQQIKLPYSQDMISLAGIADFGIKPTDMIAANKNALDQAKMLQDQQQNSPEYKGSQKLSEKTAEAVVTKLGDWQDKATDAVTSLQNNEAARGLLDSGVITGTGADYKVGFGKALQQAGISLNDDAISNTEAFTALRGREVANQIKAFGSGTGLSDNDREYAEKMVAGKVTLNEASIRKIIDISDKANANIIKLYNKKASIYSDVPDVAKAFQPIQIPTKAQPSTKTQTNSPNSPNSFNGWKIEKVQ